MEPQSSMRPAFISLQEVGAMFGISQPTVYRLIKKGDLEAVKIGNLTRVPMASIEAYSAGLSRFSTANA